MNAFHWRGQPSQIGRELQLSQIKQRNAQSGGIKTGEQTQPRRFHVYSKAIPHARAKTTA
jgi:hypothetical protein